VAEEPKKKRRVIKKSESVRERAAKAAAEPEKKPRRLKQTASKASRPLKAARRIGKKEVYLPMPDNRAGRFLNKPRRVTPRFFRDAWAEVRQVSWPTRRETAKLTSAVFVFAIGFSLVIAVVDYGLDKVFKELLLQ